MYLLLSNGEDNGCNHSLQRYVEANLEAQIFGARSLIDPLESGMGVPHRMCFIRKPYCIGFVPIDHDIGSHKIRLNHFLAFVDFPSPLVGRLRCHLKILYPGGFGEKCGTRRPRRFCCC